MLFYCTTRVVVGLHWSIASAPDLAECMKTGSTLGLSKFDVEVVTAKMFDEFGGIYKSTERNCAVDYDDERPFCVGGNELDFIDSGNTKQESGVGSMNCAYGMVLGRIINDNGFKNVHLNVKITQWILIYFKIKLFKNI